MCFKCVFSYFIIFFLFLKKATRHRTRQGKRRDRAPWRKAFERELYLARSRCHRWRWAWEARPLYREEKRHRAGARRAFAVSSNFNKWCTKTAFRREYEHLIRKIRVDNKCRSTNHARNAVPKNVNTPVRSQNPIWQRTPDILELVM